MVAGKLERLHVCVCISVGLAARGARKEGEGAVPPRAGAALCFFRSWSWRLARPPLRWRSPAQTKVRCL